MKKLLLIISFLLVNCSLLTAQWSNNSSVNTAVCNVTNSQLLPRIAVNPAGSSYPSYYITWFDNRGNGQLKLYLQVVSAYGGVSFPGGLLISDKPQNSWLGDYDLKVDADGNAIIVFSDKRASTPGDTTVNPYAYKISPTGTFLWGANGVALSSETSRYQMWPKAAVLSDGSVAFVWWYFYAPTRTTWVKFQRLNSAGVPQFGSPMEIQSPDGKRYQYPDVVASDAGSYIISWVYGPKDTVGSFVPDNVSIFCNKYNSAGTSVWGAHKTVYTAAGNTVPIYMVPTSISDRANGMTIAYYYSRGLLGFTSAVQRYLSDGTQVFTNNGVEASTNTTRIHVIPSPAMIGNTGEIYCFFADADVATQSFQSIYGQKFSSTGTRLWGDDGKQFIPITNSEVYNISTFNSGDLNAFVVFGHEVPNPVRDLVKGLKVGPSGNALWTDTIKIMSSAVSEKAYLRGALGSAMGDPMMVATWEDSRNGPGGNGTLYMQNVMNQGQIGPIGIQQISSNVPDKFNLLQNYPNPFNPTTKIKFDVSKTSFVTLNIYDNLGRFIKTLVSENLSAGTYEADFNAAGLASGIYFYQLRTDNFVQTKLMMLVK